MEDEQYQTNDIPGSQYQNKRRKRLVNRIIKDGFYITLCAFHISNKLLIPSSTCPII